MTALLAVLLYGAGFAFFLGYARGLTNGEAPWHWEDFGVAVLWPVCLFWLAESWTEGRRKRVVGVAFALLAAAAAPARATTFTLAVSTAGPVTPSAVVTSSPAGLSCPGTCSAVFAAGSTVTLTEVAPSTVAFVAWGGPGACRSNAPSCAVLVVANSTVTAAFAPLLDLAFSGNGLGVVTSTGLVAYATGAAVGAAASFVYPLGATVVLRASTGPASAFLGWTGGGCGAASTCTVTMSGYQAVTATFTASAAAYPFAVSVPLGGGDVASAPAGILTRAGVFVSTFAAGASVSLTTGARAGYRFAGWANGGCAGLAPCVVHSTSPLQGLGGPYSPAAYFYPR